MFVFDEYTIKNNWFDYKPARALTANQIRVRRIKKKIKARKMLKSKKGH